MDVDETINELCRTYRVPRLFGERMRTLLERAAASPRAKRERLLGLVERSFEEEGRRHRLRRKPSEFLSPQELKIVGAVADILHKWDPPTWLDLWTRKFEGGEDASPPGKTG